ncbi:MAG: TetR/AcrR family transcriptional regulator, partial [Corallococcus sp.]|nr:TetR/AcrR family transcriptional regulator [Corallococcus sp.]
MYSLRNVSGLKNHNKELHDLTTQSVCKALLILMKTNNYNDISVSDLCKKAGISRTAFYKNFETKDNVYKKIVLELNYDIIRKFGNPFRQEGIEWYKGFFETVKENLDFFALMLKTDFQILYLRHINKVLTDGKTNSEIIYRRAMWNGAIQNIAAMWIERGMPESVEQIAEIC